MLRFVLKMKESAISSIGLGAGVYFETEAHASDEALQIVHGQVDRAADVPLEVPERWTQVDPRSVVR